MMLDPREPDGLWTLKAALKRAADMAFTAELQKDQLAKAIAEIEDVRRREG